MRHLSDLYSPPERHGWRSYLPRGLLLFAVALLLFPGSSPADGAPTDESHITAEARRPDDGIPDAQLWAARGKSSRKSSVTGPRTGGEKRKPQATESQQDTAQQVQAAEKPLKPRSGGETEATKRGREAHIEWDPGPGFEKEVILPSGKRADAVNLETRKVKELKPDNPRAIKRGERQVEGYRRELEKERGGEWKGEVETYKP